MPVLFAVMMVVWPAQAQDPIQTLDPNLQEIRAILDQPDEQIDLARTKLTIDRMIDPSIDIESYLKRLNAMAKKIKTMLPADASSLLKMETLVQYLYKAGPWNDNQPYRYDLDDPFGRNIRNKLLPTYLTTRRGNCISMPFLFIILGQKLGLDVTASTAPLHVFVKYRLDEDHYRNFEATSGGPKLDSTFQRDMPMTKQALDNGVYMQALSKRETAAVIASTLMEFYRQQGEYERSIALANLVLEYYPKDVTAMLNQSAAYRDLMKLEFVGKFRSPADIPLAFRMRYLYLGRNMDLWREKAEALGWRMADATSEANYRQTVRRVKEKEK